MAISSRWRYLLLSGAFVATAVASIWPAQRSDPENIVRATRQSAQIASVVASTSSHDGELSLERAAAASPLLSTVKEVNLFAVKNWSDDQVKPAVSLASATTAAPVVSTPTPTISIATEEPLPYSYVGRFQDGPVDVVYVNRGGRTFEVRAGDSIEGMYKVIALEPQYVEFEQLTTGKRQRLPLPE